MLRRHVVAAGLAGGGLAHLYYGARLLPLSSLDALWAGVTGLALLQAAVGIGARHPWNLGVGAAVAGLLGLTDFQGILFESYSIFSFAAMVEGLGLLLLAAGVGLWALARSHRNPDEERLDEAGAVLVLRVGCGLAAASALTYALAELPAIRPTWLPGNALAVAGFGLVAYAARAPLMGEDEDAGTDPPAAGQPS